MKTAIYIEDGVIQLVITPETEFEKNSLSTFEEKPLEVKIFSGSFYDCRGGWVRQSAHSVNNSMYGSFKNTDDRSLILRIDERSEEADTGTCDITTLRNHLARLMDLLQPYVDTPAISDALDAADECFGA